jgi:antitoxin (DNA-binding transcriptional repressor) of toxin-antitoxin stability system
MIRISVNEAQQRFPELLVAARAGEVVEIQQNGWTFRLTAASSRLRPPVTGVPKAGRLKGQLVVPDDFDEPLEELNSHPSVGVASRWSTTPSSPLR